jgi:hypothetical protein
MFCYSDYNLEEIVKGKEVNKGNPGEPVSRKGRSLWKRVLGKLQSWSYNHDYFINSRNSLFNNFFIHYLTWDYMISEGKMALHDDVLERIWKDMRWHNWGTILAFVWWEWGKPWEPQSSQCQDIRTENLLNTRVEHYH